MAVCAHALLSGGVGEGLSDEVTQSRAHREVRERQLFGGSPFQAERQQRQSPSGRCAWPAGGIGSH